MKERGQKALYSFHTRMTFRIHCPACSAPFDIDENLVGEKGLCPSCQTRFIITRPAGADGRTTQPMAPGGAPDFVPAKSIWLPMTLALLIAAAFGWAFAWVFQQYPLGTGIKAPREITVPGRLHPIILHLPIGFLIGALVLEVFTGKKRRHSSAVTWLLWLSFLSAGVAALLGYFWAAGRSTLSDDLENHLWLGIAVPLGAFLTLLLKITADAREGKSPWPYRIALLLTVGVLNGAGHIGGKLTHGDPVAEVMELYLGKTKSPPAPATEPTAGTTQSTAPVAPVPPAAPPDTVYAAWIAPVLDARCAGCHGAEKQKGEYRVDSLAALLKSGDSEKPGLVAGKSAESLLIQRMELPEDDDEHMPPAEKTQHTADELALLKWWIDSGASDSQKLTDPAIPADMAAKAKASVEALPKP